MSCLWWPLAISWCSAGIAIPAIIANTAIVIRSSTSVKPHGIRFFMLPPWHNGLAFFLKASLIIYSIPNFFNRYRNARKLIPRRLAAAVLFQRVASSAFSMACRSRPSR